MFRSAPIFPRETRQLYNRVKRISYNFSMKGDTGIDFTQGIVTQKLPAIEPNYEDEHFDINYRWRLEAKIVAYLSMVLGTLSTMLVVVATILLMFVTVQMKRGYLKQDVQDMIPGLEPETENVYFLVGFTAVVLAAVMCGGEIWAANTLVDATSKVHKPHKALKMCAKWRNLNLGLILLSCLALMALPRYLMLVLMFWIKIRFLCVLLVWLHMRELNRESQKSTLIKQKYTVAAKDVINHKE